MPITSATSALEPARSRQRSASPPLHLLPTFTAMRPVTIIAGPPCSGRHALAVQLARRSRGVVVSGDTIAAAHFGVPFLALLPRARQREVLAERHRRLTMFCGVDPATTLHRHAHLVASASSPTARACWLDHGAVEVIACRSPVDSCLSRLASLDLVEDQIELLSRAVRAWR